jgi:hypothetical protein
MLNRSTFVTYLIGMKKKNINNLGFGIWWIQKMSIFQIHQFSIFFTKISGIDLWEIK